MEPLNGLRVLDLGHYIAGPLAGLFLADQGADVVRVVRPGAPSWETATESVLARGKRTVKADLKDPAGLAHVLELARSCDIVIENFRPGVTDRLGLGYDAVRAINPDVIYLSLPGYSRHDRRAGERAWDSSISAQCGLFTDLSVAGAAFQMPPTYTPLPLPSVYAGLWGALAATAALYVRQQGGSGDHLEVPLLDAAMSAAAGVIFQVADQPARYNAPPLKRSLLDKVSLTRVPDAVAATIHARTAGLMPPFFRSYRCRDGEQIFICAIDNANQIDKLLDATDLRQAAADLGFIQGDVLDIPATRNNINAYRGASRRWSKLKALMQERFLTDDADVWAERLALAGVPTVRQRLTPEWLDQPVMGESGVVVPHEYDDGRTGWAPAPQVDLTGTDIRTLLPQPAEPAEHWADAERFVTGTSSADVDHARPLAGVRVVDLANVIAGPAAGRTLAELGADVVHVSAVSPRMGPRMTMLLGLEVNQGKRSIACDLHTPQGQEILHRMIPDTDVLLYNKLPRQAERLGAAPDQVHQINDRTVVTAVTAYSGVLGGGWEDRPAYDPVIQALTGIMRRFGGDGAPAVHGIASCIDYFTGFSAAYGAVLGLVCRERGATRLVARTSLVRTAGWVQLPQVCSPEEPAMSGLMERGPDPFDRVYRTRDGWVHVAANHPGETGPAISSRLAKATNDEAVRWGTSVGLTVVEVRSARSLRSAASPTASTTGHSGEVLRVHHPTGDSYAVPAPTWIRSTGPRQLLGPAPRPGQHTLGVLAELGYGDAEVEKLMTAGVVTSSWFTGTRYLPE